MSIRGYLNQPAPQDTRWDLMLETLRYIFPAMMVVCLMYVGYLTMGAKGNVYMLEYGTGLFIRYCLLYISLAFVSLMLYGGYTILTPPKQITDEVSPE
jgi:hypothetical protein